MQPRSSLRRRLTPLMLAAEYDKARMAEFFLDRGAALDSRTLGGRTPLHVAAQAGSLDVVKLFLARGADFEAHDPQGATPLIYAVMENRLAVVEQLLRRRAAVNVKLTTTTVLHEAAARGLHIMVSLLVRMHADLAATDGQQQTAFDIASYFDHSALLPILQPGPGRVGAANAKTPRQADGKRVAEANFAITTSGTLPWRDFVLQRSLSGERKYIVNAGRKCLSMHSTPDASIRGCPIVAEWDTLEFHRLAEMLVVDFALPRVWTTDVHLAPFTELGRIAWRQIQAVFNLNQMFHLIVSDCPIRTLYGCLNIFGSEPRLKSTASVVDPGILIQLLLSQGALSVTLSMFCRATADSNLRGDACHGLCLGQSGAAGSDCLRMKLLDLLGFFGQVGHKGMRKSVVRHLVLYDVFLIDMMSCMRDVIEAAIAGNGLLHGLLESVSADFKDDETLALVNRLVEHRVVAAALELVTVHRILPSDTMFGASNSEGNAVKLLHNHLKSVKLLLGHRSFDGAIDYDMLAPLSRSLVDIIVNCVLTEEQIEELDRRIQFRKKHVSWSKTSVVLHALGSLELCLEKASSLKSKTDAYAMLVSSGLVAELESQLRMYVQMTGNTCFQKALSSSEIRSGRFGLSCTMDLDTVRCSNCIHWTSIALLSFCSRRKFITGKGRAKRIGESLGCDNFSIEIPFATSRDLCSDKSCCCNPVCPKGFPCSLPSATVHSYCSGCGLIVYCSEACQRSHWPYHKGMCKSVQSRIDRLQLC
ncbi:unnamed protein product [Polarella glacialis]|uniref:MYND-type domain-containing protein n=1 Tax=Polarella glacialis TaxID=89957 RepID=A0A813LVU1_POLGL|nr:unnamed protein product [Polarella glacialis]CAE8741238.1 unnamed protein product [Polarella glacialis]